MYRIKFDSIPEIQWRLEVQVINQSRLKVRLEIRSSSFRN